MSKNAPIPVPLSINNNDPRRGTSLFDREDPDSVINRVRGRLRAAVIAVEEDKSVHKIMRLSERMIKEMIRPTPRDMRVRLNFWDEFARALDNDTHIRTEYVYSGAILNEDFEETYLKNMRMMAFVLNPPASYMRTAEEILLSGLERLRDIIELPLMNNKGQVQPAVVNGVLKAVELLDKRVKGAILQKVAVHQHHTTGGVPVGMEGGGQKLAHDEIKMLENQIAEVQKRINDKYAVTPIPESISESGKVIVTEKVTSSDEEK